PRFIDSSTWACSASRRSIRACGPTCVSGARGSPMRRAPSSAANRFMNGSRTPPTTMKRLAAMQLWPLFTRRASAGTPAAGGARPGGPRGGGGGVGVGEDDEGLAPAELEHRLLELAAGALGDLPPSLLAAGEGDRGDARVGDEGRDSRRAGEHGLEDAGREAGV